MQYVCCSFLLLVHITASKFKCPGEGYQEDPNDCTKFYRCVPTESGRLQAYDFTCGPGTVYSKETENCVHPRDSSRPECASISENLIDGGDGKSVHHLIIYLIRVYNSKKCDECKIADKKI